MLIGWDYFSSNPDTLIGISLACSLAAYRHDPFPIRTGLVTMVTVMFLGAALVTIATYIPLNKFRCACLFLLV
jgi:hypothetical protein